MLRGMTEEDANAFLERIGAAAIVNQAVLKCSLAGMELTPDNVVLFIGDFVDPERSDVQGLIKQIDRTVDEVFAVAWQHTADRARVSQRKN